MSYPAIRYTATEGEINAQYRAAATPAELTTPSGDAFRYLATQRSTDGDFGLYQVDLGPGGGTSTHFHRTISEAFYILTGTLRLFDGERWIDATPGDYLYVPAGGLHAFRNESSEPISMLMIFVPGAPRERYFEGLPGLADLTEVQRADFFRQHDNYFVDPQGGPSSGRTTGSKPNGLA